jgi:hypothetical protein
MIMQLLVTLAAFLRRNRSRFKQRLLLLLLLL